MQNLLRKAAFTRALLESGLPAWLLLACLLLASRGSLSGNLGLLALLAALFPGAWGALRLQAPLAAWPRRLGYYLAFCLILGLGSALSLLAARLALGALGLFEGAGDLGKLVPFAAMPGIVFLALRMGMAFPGFVRRWGWRGCLLRTAGGGALVVVAAGGAYLLASQPYAGHTRWPASRIIESTTLTDFSQADGSWQAADPAVRLLLDKAGQLRLDYSASPAMFYSVTWQLPLGQLASAGGLQVQAGGNATTSLILEAQEAGGGRYRAWADLPAGDDAPLFFVDFVPSLDALDEDNQLDWEQVERLTFYIYPEEADTSLWLDRIDAVRIEAAAWQVAADERFWVRYHASDQAVVADVQRAAGDRLDSLTALLGYRPLGRIPITIVSTHAELEQQVGRSLPAWVAGAATPDSLPILTPRRFSPLFNRRSYESVFELVPHELTHLLVVQIVGYAGFREMPAWLNEGLATYLAGQGWDEEALRRAASQGRLPAWQDLDRAFAGQTPISNSYDAAASIVAHIVDAYGADRIPLLLEALRRGEPFDSSLQQAVGLGREALEQQWRQGLMPGSQ